MNAPVPRPNSYERDLRPRAGMGVCLGCVLRCRCVSIPIAAQALTVSPALTNPPNGRQDLSLISTRFVVLGIFFQPGNHVSLYLGMYCTCGMVRIRQKKGHAVQRQRGPCNSLNPPWLAACPLMMISHFWTRVRDMHFNPRVCPADTSQDRLPL